MRLFIAITPPDAIADALEDIQSAIPAGRLTPRENLHLTLAFLGDVAPQDAEAVHDGLSAIGMPRFQVDLAGLDTFGGRTPHVLYAGVAPNPALDALHRKVRGALHAAGLMPDRQRFRPHITLARFGHGLSPDDEHRLAAFLSARGAVRPGDFVADHFALYRSHLGRDAAVHEELERYDLG